MQTASNRQRLSRRDWFRYSALGLGVSSCGWLEAVARRAMAADAAPRRACIVLWMGGGPSQTDTFDLKPGHANGGPFREIATSAPGLQFSEYLPQLAQWGHRLAVIRSLTTKEGDHSRGTQFMHTGYAPQGPIQFPPLGALLAKELSHPQDELPNCVSIAPNRNVARTLNGGFLGPQFAPLAVGQNDNPPGDLDQLLRVADLQAPSEVAEARWQARRELLAGLNGGFIAELGGDASHPSNELVRGQLSAYERAVRLMAPQAATAFDLSQESAELRDAYGRNVFGQGCLLARRLVERGVPFVEVNLSRVGNDINSWDTHQDNFNRVQALSSVLDAGWATLLRDLSDRGLLETTTLAWLGEFGRTPKINNSSGRDHFPVAWSAVLAGGGIRGGQAIGRTTEDGMQVADRPVTCPDIIATLCRTLGIDPRKQNLSGVGRPIRIADPAAQPIEEALA